MRKLENKEVGRSEYLRDAVLTILSRQDFATKNIRHFPGDLSEALMIESKGDRPNLYVPLKIEGLYRSAPFRHLIGDSILRFEKHNLWCKRGEGQLMLAVLFDRYPPKAERDLADYSQLFPDHPLNWVLVSRDGRCGVRLLGEDYEHEIEPLSPPSQASPAKPVNLFSAKNQWLLKCMLMPGLDVRYWGGPQKSPRSVSALSDVSGIAQSTASTFIKALSLEGYLAEDRYGFRVVRHRELLEDWHYAAKRRPSVLQGVRPLYGREPESLWLDRIRLLTGREARHSPLAIGSHLACHLLDVGRSNQRPLYLHVQSPFEEVTDALDLVPDESDAPWGILVRHSFPTQVFGGVVINKDKLPIVDVLQAWLDVRLSLARGAEQAEYLYEKILSKHFLSKGGHAD